MLSGLLVGGLAIAIIIASIVMFIGALILVPVVGDFAGPKALRAVGAYLKERGATVTAFYVSNVEMYLQRNGVWPKFCANVAALPLDEVSAFVRGSNTFGAMAAETAACAVK